MRPLLLRLGLALTLVACSAEPAEDSAVESGESDFSLFPAAPLLGPEPRGPAAKYPIVLVHGFNGSPEMLGFYRVKNELEADGHVVFEARLPPFNGPEVRAKYLAEQIDEVLADNKAAKVNIIGHSMGGLDARVLVSGLGYGDRVASVTTISTPHRGTYPADVVLGVPGANHGEGALDFFARVWGKRFTSQEIANDADMRATVEAIAERNAPAFNAKYPNDPRVSYRSWAGVSAFLGIGNEANDREACDGKFLGDDHRVDMLNAGLVAVAFIVGHGTDGRANDGAVSVESAKWGEFQGCIPADHFDEVGQMKHDAPDRRTGFDHVRFHRNLAFDLARAGF